MDGFIVIDRGLVKHPVVGIRKPKWLAAWVWMLAEASWKRREVNTPQGTIILERGQFTSSIRFMALKTGMTVKGLRVFLARLKKDTMIKLEKGTGKTGQTIVTICNYDIYQDVTKSRAQHTTPQRAQQGHRKGTAGAQEGHKLEPCNPVTPESPPIVPPALFNDEEKPDGPKPRKRRTTIPDDWKPTPKHYELGQREGYTPAEVEWIADDFRDWTVNGKGYTNWNGAFSTSLRSDISRRKVVEKRKMSRGGRGTPGFIEECARQAAMAPAGENGESPGGERIDFSGVGETVGLDDETPG